MANYVNRIIVGTENAGQNQNVAGRFDAVSQAGNRQGQTSAVANALDELMNQLIDDRNETNLRSNSAMITQALKEAGLPVNEQNTAIVNALLRANMPISRDSIRSTLAEVKAYPQLDADAIVSMNRAEIPVNEESAATVREFLDNTAVLTNDANELADLVGQALAAPETPAETADALRLAVYNAVRGAAASIAAGNVTAEVASAAQSALAGLAAAAPAIEAEQLPYRIVIEASPAALPDEPATESGGEATGAAVSGSTGASTGDALAGGVAGEAAGGGAGSASPASPADSVPADSASLAAAAAEAGIEGEVPAEGRAIPGGTPEDITGRFDYSFRNFDELIKAVQSETGEILPEAKTAEELPEAFKNLTPAELKHLLKTSLSISPNELSKESIRELYERTAEFTAKVREATERSAEHSAIHSKAAEAERDLNLLNNLNRVYPHIELPLRFADSEAEGGLYVYTNRRAKNSDSDPVTALLHLNMPSLGPIDIHLSLKDRYLGMNFFTDSEAGRLLAGDITYLRERLEAKDYSMFAKFSPKEALTNTVEKDLDKNSVQKNTGSSPERLSFDIRA